MSSRPVREMKRALLSKGFKAFDGDHDQMILFVDGKKTSVFTKFSHGAKEYRDPLLAQVAKQVGLPRGKFEDLVDCPLGEEEYISLLRASGRVRT